MALAEMFEDAKRRVQATPGDVQARSALWQIFAARGEFERARTQLDAILSIDSSWVAEVQSCRGLLAAEELRLQVFAGIKPPTCLGEPPGWFALQVQALPMSAAGDPAVVAAAASLLLQAQQASQVACGVVNDQAFAWLCDGDARLGPCLELVARGQYLWLPWSRVRGITTRAPSEIRDRLWLHALIEFDDEALIEAFLPARYPAPVGDAQHLGQVTEWQPLSDQAYRGLGQKTLMTDRAEFGLLDVRRLRIESTSLGVNT